MGNCKSSNSTRAIVTKPSNDETRRLVPTRNIDTKKIFYMSDGLTVKASMSVASEDGTEGVSLSTNQKDRGALGGISDISDIEEDISTIATEKRANHAGVRNTNQRQGHTTDSRLEHEEDFDPLSHITSGSSPLSPLSSASEYMQIDRKLITAVGGLSDSDAQIPPFDQDIKDRDSNTDPFTIDVELPVNDQRDKSLVEVKALLGESRDGNKSSSNNSDAETVAEEESNHITVTNRDIGDEADGNNDIYSSDTSSTYEDNLQSTSTPVTETQIIEDIANDSTDDISTCNSEWSTMSELMAVAKEQNRIKITNGDIGDDGDENNNLYPNNTHSNNEDNLQLTPTPETGVEVEVEVVKDIPDIGKVIGDSGDDSTCNSEWSTVSQLIKVCDKEYRSENKKGVASPHLDQRQTLLRKFGLKTPELADNVSLMDDTSVESSLETTENDNSEDKPEIFFEIPPTPSSSPTNMKSLEIVAKALTGMDSARAEMPAEEEIEDLQLEKSSVIQKSTTSTLKKPIILEEYPIVSPSNTVTEVKALIPEGPILFANDDVSNSDMSEHTSLKSETPPDDKSGLSVVFISSPSSGDTELAVKNLAVTKPLHPKGEPTNVPTGKKDEFVPEPYESSPLDIVEQTISAQEGAGPESGSITHDDIILADAPSMPPSDEISKVANLATEKSLDVDSASLQSPSLPEGKDVPEGSMADMSSKSMTPTSSEEADILSVGAPSLSPSDMISAVANLATEKSSDVNPASLQLPSLTEGKDAPEDSMAQMLSRSMTSTSSEEADILLPLLPPSDMISTVPNIATSSEEVDIPLASASSLPRSDVISTVANLATEKSSDVDLDSLQLPSLTEGTDAPEGSMAQMSSKSMTPTSSEEADILLAGLPSLPPSDLIFTVANLTTENSLDVDSASLQPPLIAEGTNVPEGSTVEMSSRSMIPTSSEEGDILLPLLPPSDVISKVANLATEKSSDVDSASLHSLLVAEGKDAPEDSMAVMSSKSMTPTSSEEGDIHLPLLPPSDMISTVANLATEKSSDINSASLQSLLVAEGKDTPEDSMAETSSTSMTPTSSEEGCLVKPAGPLWPVESVDSMFMAVTEHQTIIPEAGTVSPFVVSETTSVTEEKEASLLPSSDVTSQSRVLTDKMEVLPSSDTPGNLLSLIEKKFVTLEATLSLISGPVSPSSPEKKENSLMSKLLSLPPKGRTEESFMKQGSVTVKSSLSRSQQKMFAESPFTSKIPKWKKSSGIAGTSQKINAVSPKKSQHHKNIEIKSSLVTPNTRRRQSAIPALSPPVTPNTRRRQSAIPRFNSPTVLKSPSPTYTKSRRISLIPKLQE